MSNFQDDDCDLDALVNLLESDTELGNESFEKYNGSTISSDEMKKETFNSKIANNDELLQHHEGSVVLKDSSKNLPVDDDQGIFSHVDPLERELILMEKRMKKLKEEISRKKNIKMDDKSLSFTKFSSVISPNCKKQESNGKYLNKDETENLFKELNDKKSVIHSGDTDSEDDDDNRTPLEVQLSSYGREMKAKLGHSRQESQRYSSKSQSESGWKEAKGGSLLPMGKKASVVHKDVNYTSDPFSGIRIINPIVSTSTMNELMADRRMIQISTIVSHLRGGEIQGDWVTIGIIVSKSETKISQKGSQYSIWQMSDLRDCTRVVSLFLFAGAYKHLWKTTVGSVVGILNPQVMKESDKQNNGRNCLTLSVNTHEKVLLMGTSKDLGWCKGRNKQGSNCRQFVNKNVCEFCIFHIQREYQRTSSRRAEIQSSFTRVDPRKAFRKKVLGKDQVFYGGQLYCSSSARETRKSKLSPAIKAKDLSTLSSLTLRLKAENLKEKECKDSFILKHLTDDQLTTVKNVSKNSEELGQMLLAPSPGARNLLLHKTKDVGSKDTGSPSHPPQKFSAREFLASAVPKPKNVIHKLKETPFKTPQLGRGLGPGKDFLIEVSSTSKLNPAKAKAASIIKSKGALQTPKKNMKRNRDKAATSEFQSTIKKRMREYDQDEVDDCTKKTKNDTPQNAFEICQRKSLLGSVDINSQKFITMMRAKSNHTSLIQAAEDEEVEKYYSSLEKKEMLENKMASIMEMPTSAVVCLQCKYKATSASDHCREEKHPLKIIKATKRFFECQNCKQRTSSLDKFPGKPCSHCSQSSWKRVAMAREKRGPKLESEILSLRGDELTYVSSDTNKIYLNL